VRSLAVTVQKDEAEAVRRELLAQGVLRKGAAIARVGELVYLPVTTAAIRHPTVEHEFREAFTPIRSYKDVARVPSHLRESLPTSFDVVGDIAILRIPEDLREYEAEIADAVLRAHSSLKVVAADEGVKGPLRIRSLRVLSGPPRTDTVHREFGLSYGVDVARAYFSPRLGSERIRVAGQVRPGEVVVDMFSGVGPYAILIGKRRQPAVVHAFDANPDAFRYLEENLRRNRADRVRPRLGDGIALLALVDPPHRIIVDYPSGPDTAFQAALLRILPGGTIHYYAILESVEREDRGHALVDAAKSIGRDAKITAMREVHGWSPTQGLYVFDVHVV
jgi:tRNA (guanine37-N1)-methyltransferase